MSSTFSRWLVFGVLFLFVFSGRLPRKEHRFEPRMRQFEQQDRQNPPPKEAVLFVGSSSIRLWDSLNVHFPDVPIIQRGFGGSHMVDVLMFAPRIVIPYAPRLVVVYAGDNDVTDGKPPELVVRQFEKLVALVSDKVPDVHFAFIAIKPSGSRRAHMAVMNQTNERIRELADQDTRVSFVDVWTPMLDEEGEPRQELFLEDSLHLNHEGYALWRQVISPYVYEEHNATLAVRRQVSDEVLAAMSH